jgi:hypothetical protein
MPIKSISTAIVGLTMTMLLSAPSQAHTAKHHRHYYKFLQYSHCSATPVPDNNGHDKIIVLVCTNSSSSGKHHNNGHDK